MGRGLCAQMSSLHAKERKPVWGNGARQLVWDGGDWFGWKTSDDPWLRVSIFPPATLFIPNGEIWQEIKGAVSA